MTDDGCTDGTPDLAKRIIPNIIIVKGDGMLYWNRGMWTAWNEASKYDYDYYLWLNDDTDLYPHAIIKLLEVNEEYDHKAVIVGVTQDSKHKVVTYGGRIDDKIPAVEGKSVSVDYFNGNIVLIPRFVYKRVGNLDFYFTHSKGDFDYGLRCKKVGISIFQTGVVLGECEAHQSLSRWCNPDVSIQERWKALKKPTGMPLKEIFHLNRKHYGIVPACTSVVTILLRCVFPKMWVLRK